MTRSCSGNVSIAKNASSATMNDSPTEPTPITLTSQRGILRLKIALIIAPASGSAGTSQR